MSGVEQPTVSQSIAAFAAHLRADAIPADVLECAKLHILDSLGVALAASEGKFAETMLATARTLGGEGSHRIIGRSDRLSLRDAVQVNASLIHCLDFDDTHAASVVHVSAAALPVALAMASDRRASGLEMLAAYLLSVEVAATVGAAAGGAFHKQGFHPTGLVNAFGTAVAAGWLQRLDADKLAAAQGIVLSFGSGSMEFLDSGAWTKRIHPGWAGVAGITAASLASNGFAAPPRPYEGRDGLFSLYAAAGTKVDYSGFATLGQDWRMLKVGVKPLPACHFTHAFSDAAREIVDLHAIRPDDIAEIVVRVAQGIVEVVCEPQDRKLRPLNSYETQFSLHYIVAATLARGRFSLEEIEPDAIADPLIQRLTQLVRYEVDPHADYPRYFPGEVTVKTRDGRSFTVKHPHHRGSDGKPLAAADIVEKFRLNATRVLAPDDVDRLHAAVEKLNTAPDVNELVEAMSAVRPQTQRNQSARR